MHLAEELIDNNIDSRPQHQRNSGEDGSDSNDESPVMTRTGRVRAGVSCHLTPTKRRHRDMIYIKTQVCRLLRYYSPAPRKIARSDWATQNITHNMTSSLKQPYGVHSY